MGRPRQLLLKLSPIGLADPGAEENCKSRMGRRERSCSGALVCRASDTEQREIRCKIFRDMLRIFDRGDQQ